MQVRIDWKYALGLALTDTGFDYSVLSKFRTRLISAAEQQLLDAMLTAVKARGLIKVRGKQWTDSTHVLAAIRDRLVTDATVYAGQISINTQS